MCASGFEGYIVRMLWQVSSDREKGHAGGRNHREENNKFNL